MTTTQESVDRYTKMIGAYLGFVPAAADLERLRRLARIGGTGTYRYAKPSDDDDSPLRPCQYPASLDDVLRGDLRGVDDWDQARAVVQMKACQIAQTGFRGAGRRATAEEREWARSTDAARIADEMSRMVVGTCGGCHSVPCRCVA